MQIELYNQLYKSNEMVALLSEPEHIAERRRDLTELIRVMRNAQKVIKRDPDLMAVMQIDINDSDIYPGGKNEKNTNENTTSKNLSSQNSIKSNNTNNLSNQNSYKNINNAYNQNPVKTNPSSNSPTKQNVNKKGYGNLFG